MDFCCNCEDTEQLQVFYYSIIFDADLPEEMFRFKILAALCLCGCAEEKRTDTSPGDVREEAQFHDAWYLYFAESLDWLANCHETSIPKFKKLWTGIDAIWDNPYFVITKEQMHHFGKRMENTAPPLG